MQAAHKEWIASSLKNGANIRDDKWTASLAVGSKVFIENVQTAMGASAIGRKPRETGESYQLREIQKPYIDDFGGKKSGIGPENIFGRFPKRALKLVFEWLELHREELLENWRLAEDRRPLNKIEPLE